MDAVAIAVAVMVVALVGLIGLVLVLYYLEGRRGWDGGDPSGDREPLSDPPDYIPDWMQEDVDVGLR